MGRGLVRKKIGIVIVLEEDRKVMHVLKNGGP